MFTYSPRSDYLEVWREAAMSLTNCTLSALLGSTRVKLNISVAP